MNVYQQNLRLKEYERDEKVKGMQVLNLVREFEMQKESKTITQYANKLLNITNKVKFLDSNFSNSKIVKKILVTVKI